MKMKTLELLRNLQHRLSRSRRWLFVTVIALCLVPSSTRAQGIGDIAVAASYHHKHPPGPDW